MQKTWKPIVAGILDIVSGVSGLIGAGIATLIVFSVVPFAISVGPGPVRDIPITGILSSILIPIVILIFIIGILSLIGGIYAIKRKKWKFALAGSIAAIFGSLILGMLATIFIVMANDEFES